MNISEFSLKHPLTVLSCVIAIVLLGIISLYSIPKQKLPDINYKIFLVKTISPGISAHTIDKSITKIITKKLYSLEDINSIKSKSLTGASLVYIKFKLGTNLSKKYKLINEKISSIIHILPSQAKKPTVNEFTLNSQPIIWMVIHANNSSRAEITTTINHKIKPIIDSIKGVTEAKLAGGKERAVNVSINIEKLNAYNLNLQKIFSVFKNENFSLPSYYAKNVNTHYLLALNFHFHNLSEIRNLIIATNKGIPIKLSSVASVSYANKPTGGYANLNGNHSIALGITQNANENSIALIKKIKNITKNEILPTLPQDYNIKFYGNLSSSIHAEISSLTKAIFYGMLFATLIVFIFVRNIRSSIIIFCVVSLSLLSAIITMKYYGETFNIITLLALILLVGICVDDAIIVIENNFKWQSKKNVTPLEATIKATKQVTFSVISASICIVIIFFSLVTMKGMLKIFFMPFAIIIISGVVASLLLSLTVTPLLCKYILTKSNKPNKFYQLLSNATSTLTNCYTYLLKKTIKQPWIPILFTILLILPIKNVTHTIGSGLLPAHVNYSNLLIEFTTGNNANRSYTESKIQKLMSEIKKVKAIKSALCITNEYQPNKGTIYIQLRKIDRKITTESDIKLINHRLSSIAGIKYSLKAIPLSSFFHQPLQMHIVSNDLKQLNNDAIRLERVLRRHPELGHFYVDTNINQTQYKLKVNRKLANSLGISSRIVAQITTLFGGNIKVGELNQNGNANKSYDILLQAKNNTLNSPKDLSKIYLFAPNGITVPLSSIAELKPVSAPRIITRLNTKYSFHFASTPQISLNKAVKQFTLIANTIISKNTKLIILGASKQGPESIDSMIQAGIIATLLLYFVLSIQFNSLIQPIILLIAQPLGAIGAIYGLKLFNMTINLYSLIGLLLLIGLLSKNTILLVSLINDYKAEGYNTTDALTKACPNRFIPIIMTSLTIILSMVPVFFSADSGARNQQVLAITVVCGMISSTVLSLYIVPSLYQLPSYLHQLFRKIRSKLS